MYNNAKLGDLIDDENSYIVPVLYKRLNLTPHAGQGGRRRLMRTCASRSLAFDKLKKHGLVS